MLLLARLAVLGCRLLPRAVCLLRARTLLATATTIATVPCCCC